MVTKADIFLTGTLFDKRRPPRAFCAPMYRWCLFPQRQLNVFCDAHIISCEGADKVISKRPVGIVVGRLNQTHIPTLLPEDVPCHHRPYVRSHTLLH